MGNGSGEKNFGDEERWSQIIMNKDIMRAAGFGDHVDLVEQGKCPFCGKVISLADFRDPLSVKEFHISGLCQKCQDEMFGE